MARVLLNYATLTEHSLRDVLQSYRTKAVALNDALCALPDDQLTWATVFEPAIALDAATTELAYFQMSEFHPDSRIRDACTELTIELTQFLIDQSMRDDVYAKIKQWYTSAFPTEKASLTREQVAYVEKTMRDYRMAGMDLSSDARVRVKALKRELADACTLFRQNLNNDSTVFTMTLAELDGMPQSYLDARRQSDGTFRISLKYPDYVPIMDACKVRSTRRTLQEAFKRRCADTNKPLIKQVLSMRKTMATLLGFERYSDYALQSRMAQTTKSVSEFLARLQSALEPHARRDLDALLALARKDGLDTIESHDIPYYSRMYADAQCAVSKEALKQHFPLSTVVRGTLDIYQVLLGFRFIRMDHVSATFWHPSVELYSVVERESGQLRGYFYLDLFPRDGKYSHAACFDIINKSATTVPVAIMACNFPSDFLYFDDVETFFHEFGHVMHHISSKATIQAMSSFKCEWDFVETPSQMFEEWCYAKEPLALMSTGLTDAMIIDLNRRRTLLNGLYYARQVFLAT